MRVLVHVRVIFKRDLTPGSALPPKLARSVDAIIKRLTSVTSFFSCNLFFVGLRPLAYGYRQDD